MRFLRKERAANLSLDTLIGADTVFDGCIHSERSLCVEGSVRGRIEAKGDVVVVASGVYAGTWTVIEISTADDACWMLNVRLDDRIKVGQGRRLP